MKNRAKNWRRAIRAGGLMGVLITLGHALIPPDQPYWMNLYSGAMVTLTLSNLYKVQSEQRYFKELVRKMGGRSNDLALDAADQLRVLDYLCDGSLKGENFSFANLEGVFLANRAAELDFYLELISAPDSLRSNTKKIIGIPDQPAQLSECDFSNSIFDNSYLAGANFSNSNFYATSFKGAELLFANISGADFSAANLEGANLYNVIAVGTRFKAANLDGAELSLAKLNSARLNGASLKGANLESAILVDAKLIGADLTGATLRGITLPDRTIWTKKTDMTKFTHPD